MVLLRLFMFGFAFAFGSVYVTGRRLSLSLYLSSSMAGRQLALLLFRCQMSKTCHDTLTSSSTFYSSEPWKWLAVIHNLLLFSCQLVNELPKPPAGILCPKICSQGINKYSLSFRAPDLGPLYTWCTCGCFPGKESQRRTARTRGQAGLELSELY